MNQGKKSSAGAMSVRSNIGTESSSHFSGEKSPVPYLLGGIGAMLALISFAVIILALSYYKECTAGNAEDEDVGKNEGITEVSEEKGEMRVIVIMAGNEKPTFVAIPTSVAAATVN